MAEYTEFLTFTDYGIVDCDQHIYEPADCYTSWIESKFAERTLRPGFVDGRPGILADDRVVPMDNKFEECYRPGSLKEMLSTLKKGSGGDTGYTWMPMDPAFQDPALRLQMLDQQHVDAAMMYRGSLGLFAEHFLSDDELYWASSWAYLRWMDATWGFAHESRIFMSPVVSLRDVTKAAEQIDWILARGGRSISISPGPAYGRSPGDPHFDPIWGRIAEAGAIATIHINEAMNGYKASRSAMWGNDPTPSFYTQSAWQWMWAYGEVPAMETFSALIYDNVFGRFPDLRVLSSEHGAEWLPSFLRRLDKMRGMGRNGPWIGGQLSERPSEIFKRHFKVVPYWEDDLEPIVRAVGRDVIVGGSDFPHSEGIAFPTQLVEHLDELGEDDQRFIMRDNARTLLGLS